MPEFLQATITKAPDGSYVIESERPVQGIAPGQFAVIYDPAASVCIGSGIITGRNVTEIQNIKKC